jgi:hypothetical protein
VNNVTRNGSRDFFPFHFYPHSDHVREVFLLHYAANKRYMSVANTVWEFNTQTDKKSIAEVLQYFITYSPAALKAHSISLILNKNLALRKLPCSIQHNFPLCAFHNKSVCCIDIEFPLSFSPTQDSI